MKIFYVSTCCSQKKYNELFQLCNGKLHHSINNFHLSIINGLKDNGADVTSFSGLQVSKKNTDKKIFKGSISKEDEVTYINPTIININIIKHLCTFFALIYYLIKWFFVNRKEEKTVIVDSSYITLAPITVLISRFFNCHISGIVADIYDYMTMNIEKDKKRNIFKKFLCKINKYCLNNYDSYIFLTEKMNEVLNEKNKPYMVMEGILNVDSSITKSDILNNKKVIMYSGSIYEKYGLKNLINAFTKLKHKDIELHLYGNTDMQKFLEECIKKDKRIKYFGSVNSKKVKEKQQSAYILVNPRPTDEEYTKYSFPSKTLEYMSTGNIVITTKLDGIPKEYDDYLNYFDSDSEKDIYNKLEEVLDKKNEKKLQKRAHSAKEFVENNKNKIVQTKRIIDFIKISVNSPRIFSSIENRLVGIYLIINSILLILSFFNPFGLYSVRFTTYLLYILSIVFTVIGIKKLPIIIKRFNNKEEKIKENNKIDWLKILDSKGFLIFLCTSVVLVLWYFIKYFILLLNADQSEFRMLAYTKLYSNAFDAVFNIYIVSSIANIITILLPLIAFDKKLDHKYRQRNIFLCFVIFIFYSLTGLGRMTYFKLILAVFFIFAYFFDLKKIFTKKNFKIFGIILGTIFLASCFVIYVRVFDDSFGIGKAFSIILYQFKQIFEYFLGSFRALDYFLAYGFNGIDISYGRATLAGFDEIILYPIKIFADDVYSFNQIIGEITQIGIAVGYQTPYYNAFYTSVMNFYLDFRFIGVIIFPLMHGFFIKYVIDLYNKDNNLINKILIIFVSINLLMGIIKWEYQSGNIIFLTLILIIISNLDKIIKFIKGVRKNENNVDS